MPPAPPTGLSDVRFASLAPALAHAPAGEVGRFWERVSRRGTPLLTAHPEDPGRRLATFLWRAAAPLGGVHLSANRVTDKQRHAEGEMAPIPGTDVWGLTLDLPAALRFSYGFTPRPPGTPPSAPALPGEGPGTLPDPLNRSRPLRADGPLGLSVFAGDAAPPQPEWEGAAPPPGRVHRAEVPVAGGAPRRVRLYAPAPSDAPAGLLVLFDGKVWFGDLHAPAALEAAAAAGRIPPFAVLGVENHGRADRVARLGADPAFLHAVAEHLVPWAERRLAGDGVRLAGRERRVLCGQSLGGLSALFAAVQTPGAYGAVIAHSPSMWWRPGGTATPSSLGAGGEPDWITRQIAERPATGVRVRLDVGTREGPTVAHARTLAAALRSRGYPHRLAVYEGGHDFACWRGALLDGLAALSAP
ncbi:alpha/beta hydrolase-fold protein [Nocardiopsis composta]|uniref:alpha/beta hydrolase-fold protein n=1 Tax=Nocardiopsis composta TaxID=157465 RepID=UPI0031DEF8A5